MDEDSKIIEELRQSNEYQKAQILHLEKALKQAIAGQEEVRMMNSNEIQKSKEMTEDLKKKLANCMSTIESKNVELLNLQTALGQYFAEVEAKVIFASVSYRLCLMSCSLQVVFLTIVPVVVVVVVVVVLSGIFGATVGFDKRRIS
jgi:hypothetical protein